MPDLNEEWLAAKEVAQAKPDDKRAQTAWRKAKNASRERRLKERQARSSGNGTATPVTVGLKAKGNSQ